MLPNGCAACGPRSFPSAYKPFLLRNTATMALACPWPISNFSLRWATCYMWASLATFFSSFIQCSIGLPYFFSIEGKYDAGPVTFFSTMPEF